MSRDKAVRYARDCVGDGAAGRGPDAVRFADGPIRLFSTLAR